MIQDALNTITAQCTGGGRWEVIEWWNLDHPDCPIVFWGKVEPWTRANYPLRTLMTEQEYQRRFGRKT